MNTENKTAESHPTTIDLQAAIIADLQDEIGRANVKLADQSAEIAAPVEEVALLERQIQNLKRHIAEYCPAAPAAPFEQAEPQQKPPREAWDTYGTGFKPWSHRIPANSTVDIIADAMQAELNDLRRAAAAPAAPLPAQPEQLISILEEISVTDLAYKQRDLATKALEILQQSGSIRPSAEPAGQLGAWIAADDCQPPESIEVLICGERWDSQGLYQAVARRVGDEYVDDIDSDIEYINVTHWMPLPAAPVEQTSSAACGGCSQESPASPAAPLPELTGPSEAEKLQRQNMQMMADCMDMVRADLIEMGIIDKSVAPMFIPEAVANYCKRLAASPSPAPAPTEPQQTLPLCNSALRAEPASQRDAFDEVKRTLHSCSPEEIEAFEVWAAREKYDMTTHPMHWLFLNPETYAARQGWKEGLSFARSAVESASPASRMGGITSKDCDFCEGAGGWGSGEDAEGCTKCNGTGKESSETAAPGASTERQPMQILSEVEVMKLRDVGAAWMSQDGRDALDDWLLAVQSPPVGGVSTEDKQ